MKVNVSWKDINNGIPHDQENCAIACALMRKFKTTDINVSLEDDELVLRVGNEYYDRNHIDNTELIEEFISDYDTDGQSVSPFKFEIDTSRTTI